MTRALKHFFLIAFLLGSAIGAKANPTYTIKTKDGLNYRIEACADGIYRIRVSPRKDFSESLMERYGLIRTDWSTAGEKVSGNAKTWTLATDGYRLSIDKKKGTISLSRYATPWSATRS